MSIRYNRVFIPNEIYFITFTILGWKKIFLDDETCQLVYKWFDYMKSIYGNEIFGYAIMPNHIHLLIKITDKAPLPPTLIQNAKRFLAYDIVKTLELRKCHDLLKFFAENAKVKYKAKHKVFEDGYDCLLIQTSKFFLEKINYIHNNPCQEKWSLAKNPEDYKYSSAANYILDKGYYKIKLMEFLEP